MGVENDKITRSTSRTHQGHISMKMKVICLLCLMMFLVMYRICISTGTMGEVQPQILPQQRDDVRRILNTLSYEYLRNMTFVYGQEPEMEPEDDDINIFLENLIIEARADYNAPLKTIHITRTMARRRKIYDELEECIQYKDNTVTRPGVIHDPYKTHRYLWGGWKGWCAGFVGDTEILAANIVDGVYTHSHYYVSDNCNPRCYKNTFDLLLIVRHPFERLYSYYKQNFKNLPISKYYKYALTIATETRLNQSKATTTEIERNLKGATQFLEKALEGKADLALYYDKTNIFLNPLGPTFAEFVRFLMQHAPLCPGSMLLHPMCKLCGEEYKHLLNYYGLRREILFLWNDVIPQPVKNSRSMYPYPNEQRFFLEEVREAFESVPNDLILQLAKIFKADLDFIEQL